MCGCGFGDECFSCAMHRHDVSRIDLDEFRDRASGLTGSIDCVFSLPIPAAPVCVYQTQRDVTLKSTNAGRYKSV